MLVCIQAAAVLREGAGDEQGGVICSTECQGSSGEAQAPAMASDGGERAPHLPCIPKYLSWSVILCSP
jgi:hypothetical protein